MTAAYIARQAPVQLAKVWGGQELHRRFGKPWGGGAPIGESWEVADLPEADSLMAEGPLRGLTLRQVIARDPEAWLGPGATPQQRFPLLVKLLDAQQDLSVQVHPGPEHLDAQGLAALGPDARPKDECWIILAAAPGGFILHGFSDESLDAQGLAARVARGQALGCLRRAQVSPGQVIHVPPGTVHAIGAGVVLLEIQQPSDTTYRVYDYDRPGIDGATRPLHLPQALRVARFGAQPPLLTTPLTREDAPTHHLERLIQTPAYTIERVTLRAAQPELTLPDALQPRVAVALGQAVTLQAAGQAPTMLAAAQTAIIPPQLGPITLRAQPGAQLIVAWA